MNWHAVAHAIFGGISAAIHGVFAGGRAVARAIARVDWGAVGHSVAHAIGHGIEVGLTTVVRVEQAIARMVRRVDWRQVATEIRDGFRRAIHGIGNLFGQVGREAGKGASIFGGIDWKKEGRSLFDGITRAIDFISTQTGKIADKVANVLNKVPWKRIGHLIGQAIAASVGVAVFDSAVIATLLIEIVRKMPWKKITDAIFHMIWDLGNGIIEGFAELMGSLAWAATKRAAQVIVDAFCSFFEISSPSKVMYRLGGNVVDGLVNGIVDSAVGIWGRVSRFGTDILNGMLDLFGVRSPSVAMHAIGADITQGLINGILDVGIGIWSRVSRIGTDILTGIRELFGISSPSTVMHGIGGDITQGLINGIVDAAAAIPGAVGSIGRSIVDGVRNFFGIHSPSTVMHELGGHIATGLIHGILDSGQGMGSALDRIFSGALRDPWGWLVSHVDDLGSILDKVPGLTGAFISRISSGALGGLEHMGSRIWGKLFGGDDGGGGNLGGVIAASLGIGGFPQSWAQAMRQIIARESGGNATAVNPISVGGEHATGIAQMLPSTFAAYALRGHGNIFSALDNLLSSERYIAARYGSPDRIPNLWTGNYLGYDSGGILPPGRSLVINKTGLGEPAAVFNREQWSTLHSLAGGRDGGNAADMIGAIHVYIGDKEISDMVDVRIAASNGQVVRRLTGGVKRR
ncbi:transglycosylase SLT domain-containing protein [Frankia sp. CIT1]|uniref:transglycosylase SLT domain-containing protein n=1 Tax=Frankia sp. CIT1 TaxID=2880974 RepID=UPI001EF524C8|nr:transglycosylase SLT domain-containing protein [Frankia sp. CIT1]